MNDMTQQPMPDLPATRQHAAPAVTMPTAIALYLDDALYDRVSSVAGRMAKAKGVTPNHLMACPEACFAVVSRAITWRLDPFAVAMATYQTPGGQIGFEGKLVHAIIENSGRLDPASGGIKYEHYGDWSKVQGRFKIVEKEKEGGAKATRYAAPTWTDDDARTGKPTDQTKYPFAQSCGVRVSAHVRGESEPRILDFDLIQAQPRNSTLWATDPMTQICYTAIRRFGSLVVSALLMGVPFDPVDQFAPSPAERDVTGSPIGMPQPKAGSVAPSSISDVDMDTGEVIGRDPVAATPAPQPTAPAAPAAPQPAAAEPQPAAGNGAPAGDLLGGGTPAPAPTAATATAAPKPAATPAPITGMDKPASDAQKNMIAKMGERAGLQAGDLDAKLIEKFAVPLAQLPMGLVQDVAAFMRALTPA